MSGLFAEPLIWHLLAIAAHLLLGLYVVLAGGGGLLRNQWVLLAVAGVIWSSYSAWSTFRATNLSLTSLHFAVEMLYLFAWFAVLYRLLRGPYRQSMPETVRRLLYLIWTLIFLAGIVVAWFVFLGDGSARAASYYHVIGLGAAMLCFALSAQLKRDAPVEDRISLNLLATAGGLVGIAQTLVLGVATLAAAAPQSLLVVRAIVATVAASAALFAARRNIQWSLEIFVSPQARTYVAPAVALSSIFLLLLALTPLLRSMQMATAQSLGGLIIVLLGAPVALLLFSENLSARLRVFVSKHFLPFRYDYREEWLRLIDTLASPEQRLPLPERSIKAVAQIVGAPAGLLWLRKGDNDPYVCVANWNTRIMPDIEVSNDDPIVSFMLARQWIVDSVQLDREPELYEGLRRPAWVDTLPDALLVVPLISNENLIGFVILFQSSSAFRLTFEEIDLLRTSGRQVASHLAQYMADQQLAEVQQFEAFNRLTAFVMHDLKNLIAQQSLMVKNAAKHKGKPEFFEDAMATIENSVARMNKLLRQLQSGDAPGIRHRVCLGDALRDAVAKTESRLPEPVCTDFDETLYAHIEPERFSSVVAHLIRNAQEATVPDGHVEIRLQKIDGKAEISIVDDGCGMPAEFVRNRLFRPFDTTKGSQGMGIGAYQARTFVAESGGSVDVRSEIEKGTEIVIRLPLAGPEF